MLTELWNDLRYRVRAIVRRSDLERDLDDELRFHLEQEAEKYRRAGLSDAEARRRARLVFGGVDSAKEESRDARGTSILEALAQDLRYAMRGLRAKPTFTLGVVLTFALGIGANAAMFGIIDRLLLRAPPYLRDAAQVHRIYLSSVRDRATHIDDGFQFPRYRDLVAWTHSFADAAAFASRQMAVGDGDAARQRHVVGASASYFDFFDAPPALGRYFAAREDSVPLGAPVAVLGYRFWQQEFGGRPDVLGTQLRVDHTLCTIIGVVPDHFRGVEETRDPDVYIPLSTFGMDVRGPSYVTNYGFHWIGAIVRRKSHVGRAAAEADLTAAYQRSWLVEAATEGDSPQRKTHLRALLGPVQFARGPLAGPEAKLVLWAGGVTLIVLLIACANVANLFLARSLVRRREIALRRALGGTRGRLAQQFLTEALVLAAVGGLLGLIVAQAATAIVAPTLISSDVAPTLWSDRRVLIAALLITGLVAMVTGLAPVAHVANPDLSRVLNAGSRDTGLRAGRGRATLLVLQAALSVVLLVGAGLFVRSLQRVRALRLGYDVDPVLLVMVFSRGVAMDSLQRIALESRLVDAAHAVPGVTGASVVSSVPFWGFEGRGLYVPGIDSVDVLGNFDLQAVGPEYFAVTGTRVLRGRAFDARDVATSTAVTIVSEGMAHALWPGREPLGKCIHVAERTAPCAVVVGVAEDLRLHTLSNPREYIYYLPMTQFAMPTGMLFVRVAGNASQFTELVRRRLQQEMPGASYVTAQPFRDVIDPAMRTWRVGAQLFVAFGALALIIAAVGLHSVIAYGVAQRRRELGVRIALGASPANLMRLVVLGGLRLMLAGIAIGTAVALAAGRGIAGLLFQETPNDPLVYGLVAGVLLLVSIIATTLPALAAARVDPNLSLREE